MDRLFENLRPLIKGVVKHAGLVLVAAAIISAAGFHFASRLSIDTDLANLIPKD